MQIKCQRKYMDRCRRSGGRTDRGNGLFSMTVVGRLAALAFLLFTACQQTPKHPAQLVAKTPSYLSAGDVVKITFPAAPELNQSQKIGTDGTLSLPLVGEVHAAGKTPTEL